MVSVCKMDAEATESRSTSYRLGEKAKITIPAVGAQQRGPVRKQFGSTVLFSKPVLAVNIRIRNRIQRIGPSLLVRPVFQFYGHEPPYSTLVRT